MMTPLQAEIHIRPKSELVCLRDRNKMRVMPDGSLRCWECGGTEGADYQTHFGTSGQVMPCFGCDGQMVENGGRDHFVCTSCGRSCQG